MLNGLVRSSKAFLYTNGFLLLTITFIPFPTAVLAAYANTPQANVAVMFNGAAWLLVNAGFNIWWLSILRPVRLLPPSVRGAAAKSITIQIFTALPVYATTIVISYWLPIVGLIIIAGLHVLWIVMSVGDDQTVR